MGVNELQKTVLFPKIKAYFNNDLNGKKIALWGLAFKPDTDDIREAPALYMIDALTKEGAEIVAYDPEAMPNVQNLIGDKIGYASDEYAALKDADVLLICTEWGIFRNPDFNRMASSLKNKVVFDGRNLFEVEEMREKGFYYSSIGRNTASN
jgi:UDPglucose 6-dehydrogenase